MIKTWMADISPLYEEKCYRKYYNRAPEFRRKKADALRMHEKKAQSIGVWSVFAAMKETYHIAEHAVYNFSHSGKLVMCSVAIEPTEKKVRLGCDVEAMKLLNLAVAERYFCQREYGYIMAGENSEVRNDRFYRYWVLKESFLKATRKGMALDMHSFELELGISPKMRKQPEEFSERYYYKELELPWRDYKAAVCSTDSDMEAVVQMRLEV